MPFFNRNSALEIDSEYQSIFTLSEDQFVNSQFTIEDFFQEALYSLRMKSNVNGGSFIIKGVDAWGLNPPDDFFRIGQEIKEGIEKSINQKRNILSQARKECHHTKMNVASFLGRQHPSSYSDPVVAFESVDQDFKFLEEYIDHCDNYYDKFSKSGELVRQISFCIDLQNADLEKVKDLHIASGEYFQVLTNKTRLDFYKTLINEAYIQRKKIRNDVFSAFLKFKTQLNGYSLNTGRIPAFQNFLTSCDEIQRDIDKLEDINVKINSLVSLSKKNLNLDTSNSDQLPAHRIFILEDQNIKLFDIFKRRFRNLMRFFEKKKQNAEALNSMENDGYESKHSAKNSRNN